MTRARNPPTVLYICNLPSFLPACDSRHDQDCIFVKVNRLHSDSGGTDYLQLSYGDLLGHYTWLLQLFVLLAV